MTLSRTGNFDAALEVPLSFTESADIDTDYTVQGAVGVGAVAFTLTPVIDEEQESKLPEERFSWS